MSRGQGKYVVRTTDNPSGIARCDYTGLIVQAQDLRKQMEYSGSGLYWTGLLVHRDYLDPPQPAVLAPKPKIDPVVLKNPRPSQEVSGRQLEEFIINTNGSQSFTMDYSNIGVNPIVVGGTTSANPFYLFFPQVLGNWDVTNGLTVPVVVSLIGPINPLNPAYIVLPNTTQPFWADGTVLQTTPFAP